MTATFTARSTACVERALAYGPLAALDDRPRPGKEPLITVEAKAWLAALACQKAKDLGYPHELWTTRLLAHHAREHGPAEGHACLGKLVQGTVCKILNTQEIKPQQGALLPGRSRPGAAGGRFHETGRWSMACDSGSVLKEAALDLARRHELPQFSW